MKLAVLLVVQVLALACVVFGVALVSVPAGFIVGGLFVAVAVERLT